MVTRSAKIDQKADLIWAIADKLTGVYKPHEYGDVIKLWRKPIGLPVGVVSDEATPETYVEDTYVKFY